MYRRDAVSDLEEALALLPPKQLDGCQASCLN